VSEVGGPDSDIESATLRRTFASILAFCDVPPRRAMYLLGHTDPKLTLAVYLQVLDLGTGSVETLEQALGCALAGARAIFNGESTQPRVSGTNPEPATKKLPPRATRPHWRPEKPAVLQGIPREGMKGLEPSTFCMPNGSSWILREARKVPICSEFSSG
jgi:hypothetical protein